MTQMLKVAEIQQLEPHDRVIREVTSPAQGLVLLDCKFDMDEEEEGNESVRLSAPLHWRAGTWTKPPIDITLRADDGRFQSLQLVLQDETIPTRAIIVPGQATSSCKGIPIFDRTAWQEEEYYIDERLQPMLSWQEYNSVGVVFASMPVQVAQVCEIDASLMFLLDEQNQVIGFRINNLTKDEKHTLRWAAPNQSV
jgi:hypothetical protein